MKILPIRREITNGRNIQTRGKKLFHLTYRLYFLAAFYAYSGVMFANYSLESGYTRLDSVFGALLIIIIVLIPVLTMRTISEEKRTKTDQCLLTAPVGLGSIVVGKFLAAFLIYIIAIAITGVFAVVVSAFGTPDWNVVVGNIVALALVGGAYIAIGIFCSSFTENQIVAAVISFIALIFVSFLSTIGNLLPLNGSQQCAKRCRSARDIIHSPMDFLIFLTLCSF